MADAAMLSSLADETAGRALDRDVCRGAIRTHARARSRTRNSLPSPLRPVMSGVDFEGHSIRKGAADSVRRWVVEQGGVVPDELETIVDGHRDARRNSACRRERAQGPRSDLPQGTW